MADGEIGVAAKAKRLKFKRVPLTAVRQRARTVEAAESRTRRAGKTGKSG
jgi:hypothetical protein